MNVLSLEEKRLSKEQESSHTTGGRAGHAPTWVSSKIWYLYQAIDFVNLYKLKTVTTYPTASVGASLLVRLECANILYRNEKGISA